MLRVPALLAALALLGALPASAAQPVKVEALMQKAAAAYKLRAQPGKAAEAARLYEKVLALDGRNEKAAVELARTMVWIGNHGPKDKAVEAFAKGRQAGEKAVALNPRSVGGHYWLGVNLSFYGKARGIFKSLSLVDPIMKQMAKVIELDPKYEAGGAYRVLGRVYFKLPGLFGGSNRKSIANLRQAIKYGPRRWLSHVYLAETLIDEDQEKEARALLKQVLAGPAPAGLEPEYADWRKMALDLLKKLD